MKIQYVKKQVSVDIVQISTIDERFYMLRDLIYASVTWIAGYVPKGVEYYKWLASLSWNEAEAIRESAGNKGSKVHQAIHSYVQGHTIRMEDKFINNITGNPEELTVPEYEAILSFDQWFNEIKPKVINTEMVVLHDANPKVPGDISYAGTLDLIVEIRGQRYVIDIKTSKNVYLEHEIQVSAYKHALPDSQEYSLAILQVGYAKNQRGYKFNEIEDKYPLFLAAAALWKDANPNAKPKQKDYPVLVHRFDVPTADVGEAMQPPIEKPLEIAALLPSSVRGEGGSVGESLPPGVSGQGSAEGTLFSKTVEETIKGAEGARQSGSTGGTTVNVGKKGKGKFA